MTGQGSNVNEGMSDRYAWFVAGVEDTLGGTRRLDGTDLFDAWCRHPYPVPYDRASRILDNPCGS